MTRFPSIDSDAVSSPSRRRVLQMTGVAAVGIGAVSGSASAHKSQFFGCTQVCSGTIKNDAVVLTDEGNYECRDMGTRTTRQNQWYNVRKAKEIESETSGAHCYELADDEQAIVGMIESGPDYCRLCLNPNRCAKNYYDPSAVEEILADLEENGCRCVPADSQVDVSECGVRGSSGGTGQDTEDRGGGPGNGEKRGKSGGSGNGNGNGPGNGSGRGGGHGNGRGNRPR